MKELLISSPQFENEGRIPDCCAGFAEDKSPELHIEGIPAEAVSLAVILDDLGHPIQPGFNHWTAWNIPPVSTIPRNLPAGAVVEEPIHIEQGAAYGKHRYRGPKPPINRNHRYRFTVFALDIKLDLQPDARKSDLLKAIENHVLAEGTLFGTYQRKPN